MKNQKHSRFEKLFAYITTTTILISNLNLISFAGAGNDNGDLIKQGASNLTLTQEDNPNNRISSQNPDEPLKVDKSSDDNNPDVEEDTIKISSYEELCDFATIINDGDTSKDAELTNDITADESLSWKPIGTKSHQFSGHFNGNNHSIIGLKFTSDDNISLFEYISNKGTVENVKINGSELKGKENVAGICVYNYGTIQHCENNRDISGNKYVGGICARNSGTIKYCTNTGNISGIRTIGGNVGQNSNSTSKKTKAIVFKCDNKGQIQKCEYSKDSGNIGGNIGINGNSGQAINCNNSGTVSGTSKVGGNVGQNQTKGTVKNCENKGNIECQRDYIGGNVGQNESLSEIEKCKNYGEISGSQYVGGNVGQNNYKVTNCENHNKISGKSDIGGNVGQNSSKQDKKSIGLVKGCINDADISGNTLVGGNVGRNQFDANVTDCTNNGKINGRQQVGGNIGSICSGKINNCQNNGELTGSNYVGGIAGITYDVKAINECTNSFNITYDKYNHKGDIYGDISLLNHVPQNTQRPEESTSKMSITDYYTEATDTLNYLTPLKRNPKISESDITIPPTNPIVEIKPNNNDNTDSQSTSTNNQDETNESIQKGLSDDIFPIVNVAYKKCDSDPQVFVAESNKPDESGAADSEDKKVNKPGAIVLADKEDVFDSSKISTSRPIIIANDIESEPITFDKIISELDTLEKNLEKYITKQTLTAKKLNNYKSKLTSLQIYDNIKTNQPNLDKRQTKSQKKQIKSQLKTSIDTLNKYNKQLNKDNPLKTNITNIIALLKNLKSHLGGC